MGDVYFRYKKEVKCVCRGGVAGCLEVQEGLVVVGKQQLDEAHSERREGREVRSREERRGEKGRALWPPSVWGRGEVGPP